MIEDNRRGPTSQQPSRKASGIPTGVVRQTPRRWHYRPNREHATRTDLTAIKKKTSPRGDVPGLTSHTRCNDDTEGPRETRPTPRGLRYCACSVIYTTRQGVVVVTFRVLHKLDVRYDTARNICSHRSGTVTWGTSWRKTGECEAPSTANGISVHGGEAYYNRHVWVVT